MVQSTPESCCGLPHEKGTLMRNEFKLSGEKRRTILPVSNFNQQKVDIMDYYRTSFCMDLLHHDDETDRLVQMAEVMLRCFHDPGVLEHAAPPATPVEEQDHEPLIMDLDSPQTINAPCPQSILLTVVPPYTAAPPTLYLAPYIPAATTFFVPPSTSASRRPDVPPSTPASRRPDVPPSTPEPKPYVKKPPNAFMIFRKEQRPLVVAQHNVRDCAIVNKILGERWHSLSATEKEKYYEQARKESQQHYELHPAWKPNRKVKKVKQPRA